MLPFHSNCYADHVICIIKQCFGKSKLEALCHRLDPTLCDSFNPAVLERTSLHGLVWRCFMSCVFGMTCCFRSYQSSYISSVSLWQQRTEKKIKMPLMCCPLQAIQGYGIWFLKNVTSWLKSNIWLKFTARSGMFLNWFVLMWNIINKLFMELLFS